MPIYEYVCESCKARFEKLVRSMSSADNVECPSCGKNKVQRQFSAFAVGSAQTKPSGGHGGGCGCCNSAGTCPSFQE